MALIKSISGIRGTIGGNPGHNLTPPDIIRFTAAYASWLKQKNASGSVVVGRDGRMSGPMVQAFVVNTLIASGLQVIDLGITTTPTVELAVTWEKADGGIIITASHNAKEWNALKLLNEKGEFISAEDGDFILDCAEKEAFSFAAAEKLGSCTIHEGALQKHIRAVADYPLTDTQAIRNRQYKVVVDVINSSGALAIPPLLAALGIEDIVLLNGEMNGRFAHNPEPLPENLSGLSTEVRKAKADFGIAVDPDVDRLCFVCEDGSMFGEEFTLVAVADYVLSRRSGNSVSNMSSTKALKEITIKHGGAYFPSAVGEVNVVQKMKEVEAVIGGEGNGGIIVPDFHYGRDALIGIGLFVSAFAQQKSGLKSFRSQYPDYFISKNKVELNHSVDVKALFDKIKGKYVRQPINTDDGLKIEFDSDWVHLRTSNTEPIIRIYAESNFETTANNIAMRLMQDIKEFL